MRRREFLALLGGAAAARPLAARAQGPETAHRIPPGEERKMPVLRTLHLCGMIPLARSPGGPSGTFFSGGWDPLPVVESLTPKPAEPAWFLSGMPDRLHPITVVGSIIAAGRELQGTSGANANPEDHLGETPSVCFGGVDAVDVTADVGRTRPFVLQYHFGREGFYGAAPLYLLLLDRKS